MSGTRAISSRRIERITVRAVAEYLDSQYTPTKAQKQVLKEEGRVLYERHGYQPYNDANFGNVNQNLASAFSITPTHGSNQTIYADWGTAALVLTQALQQVNESGRNPGSPMMQHYAKTVNGVPKRAKEYIAQKTEQYYQGTDQPESSALNELVTYIFNNCDNATLKSLNALWTPDEPSQKRIDDSVAYQEREHQKGLERGWTSGDFDEASARLETFGYQQLPRISSFIQRIMTDGTAKILDMSNPVQYASSSTGYKHLLVEAMLENEHTQKANLLTALYINQTYFVNQSVRVESVASYQPESRGSHTTPPTMVRYYDVANPIINNEYLARMVVPVHDWWGKGDTKRFSNLTQRILEDYTKVVVASAKARVVQQTAHDKRQYDFAKEYVTSEVGYLAVVQQLAGQLMRDEELPETFIPTGHRQQVGTFNTLEWIEWTGGMDKLDSAFRTILNRNVGNHKNRLAEAKRHYERTLKQRRETLQKLKVINELYENR